MVRKQTNENAAKKSPSHKCWEIGWVNFDRYVCLLFGLSCIELLMNLNVLENNNWEQGKAFTVGRDVDKVFI